jgi:hypothetical protein
MRENKEVADASSFFYQNIWKYGLFIVCLRSETKRETMKKAGDIKAHEADTLEEINDWVGQLDYDIIAISVQDMGNSYTLFYSKIEEG